MQLDAIHEAAQKGDAAAQLELADAFHHGRGVAKNLLEASRWYELAARSGQAEAQHKLALLY
ncbi:MAG: hypothetical protein K2X81_17320, partial [Candidatus Obscuribacterales bacterium]|nr:hypothetical protein [Candidatus Obscuribacterales bacterium]